MGVQRRRRDRGHRFMHPPLSFHLLSRFVRTPSNGCHCHRIWAGLHLVSVRRVRSGLERVPDNIKRRVHDLPLLPTRDAGRGWRGTAEIIGIGRCHAGPGSPIDVLVRLFPRRWDHHHDHIRVYPKQLNKPWNRYHPATAERRQEFFRALCLSA